VLFNISAGQLLTGSDTLTATYTPDTSSSSIYNGATGTTTVSVTTPGKLTPTVSVSPLSTSITTAQSVTVNVLVSTSSGPSPTGTVTVTIGSYTSPATPLTNANASVIISGSSLSPGTYTPTAHYSGDTNFNSASGTANNSVTVTAAPTATLTVSITGSGSVTSTDGHINCPGTCSYGYAFGTSVLLIANKAAGYYDQWTGCDAIDGTTGGCMLTMSQSRTVGIVFTQQPKGIMLVQPGSFTFPAQVLGTSSTAQPELVIANGGAALDEVFASLGGPNTSDFSISNQCQAYGVNSTCYIYVTFTPTAIGIRSASLTVSSANATVTPQVFSLSGAGVVIPTVNVTASSTAISANQAMTLDVLVSGNYGTPTGSLMVLGSGLNLTGIPLTDGNAVVNIPAGSLAPGSDTFSVDYTPDTNSSTIYLYAYASVTVTVAGATSYSVPTEPVGTQSPTQTAAILVTSGFTLGSINVTTMGTPNLDFKYAPGGTCTVGTAYTAGQTCTVDFTFSPIVPGARLGAIDIYDNSTPTPILEATLFLNGTGTGPMANFLPGVQNIVGSGLYDPFGVAVDGSGNVYISDTLNNRVLKETLSAGTYTQSTIVSGLADPDQIAVDGNGNIYIADTGNSRVLMETPSVGGYSQSTVGTGLSNPDGVAVDGSGNVYIADTGNNRVLMETISSGSYIQSTVASNGLNVPTDVAVDGNGNVYIADDFNDRVLMETWSGSAYVQSTIASGFDHPYSVAVDGVGNVYVADSYNNQVLKETLSAGSYSQTTIGSGLNIPVGVAVDGNGNVYIADTSDSRVLKEDLADPPIVSFATTVSGSTSPDSPQTVTLVNDGNTQLMFSVPQSGNNPSISTNFTVDRSTTCPQLSQSSAQGTLAAGANCIYALDFSPTEGGNISGSLVVGDNNLNAANGFQTITLSGIATWIATITVSPASSSITTTQALPVTITVSGGLGSPTPTGTVTVSSGSYTSFAGTLIGGSATINIPAGSLAVGSDTLTASYTPDPVSSSIYNGATGTSSAVTVTQTTQTITFANPGTQTVGTPLTLSATATSGLAVSFTSTTTSICTVSGTTATFIASGTCTIDANEAGNSTYAAAPMVLQSFTVNGEAQTITFPAVPAQMVGTPLTLSATATSGLAISFTSTTTGICTVSGTTATLIASGTCTIDANQTGNSTYAPAPQVQKSFTVNSKAQTINFPTLPAQTVGTPLALSATASSGLPVAFTSTTTSICTVSGTTTTFIASGICTIDANQAGNSNYTAAPMVQQSFTVNGEVQAITFPAILAQTVGTPLALSATASSGLPVAFTSTTTSICTVSGKTATFIAPGICTIDANQTGSSVWAAATPVSQSFTVNPVPGFTLSASPTTVSIAQGGNETTTITMTDVGGFSGTVSLSASGLPSGVTASFAAGSTGGTQVLTLTASTSATVTFTPVTVTITGTSGTLSATTSIALTITAEPSFAAGTSGTTSITLTPGATTGNTGTISVVGTNGFKGTVTLSCNVSTSMTNINDMPTCSLNPTSVSISGTTAQTSTLTATTTPASSAVNQMKKLLWPSAGGTALALALLFAFPRRRSWLAMVGLLVLFIFAGTMGCGGGGGGGGGGGNTGTTPGTYTITVSGTSGAISATVGTITLTVQ
jgi:sugar lactone lactonase YvrE